MVTAGNRKSIAVFIALGAVMVALAVALNVGWIIISWKTGLLLVSGVLLFGLIITGVVLNTIFLVREIRRNEQKDAFINAVTHELKTPVASMRLYLQTLQSRNIDEAKRKEFYRIMLEDSDRLMGTIEQVLHAGRTSARRKLLHRSPVDVRLLVKECVEISRSRHHLRAERVALRRGRHWVIRPSCMGDEEELKAAILNLIDNAVKYSGASVDVAVRAGEESGRPPRSAGKGQGRRHS